MFLLLVISNVWRIVHCSTQKMLSSVLSDEKNHSTGRALAEALESLWKKESLNLNDRLKKTEPFSQEAFFKHKEQGSEFAHDYYTASCRIPLYIKSDTLKEWFYKFLWHFVIHNITIESLIQKQVNWFTVFTISYM